MVWLMVLIAIVLVIGPVLYLLPGRRDKDQQLYRAEARRCGLTVELATLYKIESEAHERVSAGGARRIPRISMARYGLPQERPLPGLPELHLVRGRTVPWQDDPEYAAMARGGNPADQRALSELIQPFLGRLPGSSRGLALTPSLVWVYWQEMPDEGTETAVSEADARSQIESLKAVLHELRTVVSNWHAQSIS